MQIKHIVIHCCDTPNDREVSAAEIHRWHSDPKPKGNGWSGIGYNDVICRDGELQPARPWYWSGAHVRDFDGDGLGNNHDSIGICLIGRDQFTDEQFSTLTDRINDYLVKFPGAEVVGHYQLDERKTCPNFDVTEWWYNT